MSEWVLRYEEDEDLYVATNGTDRVPLGDDDDEAMRLFALRKHLDNWGAPMVFHHCDTIEVNARKQRHGLGPEECVNRVALLREALSRITDKTNALGVSLVADHNFDVTANCVGDEVHTQGPHRVVHALSLTLSDLSCIGYVTLVGWFKMDCPDLVARGVHELVNTLYFLTEDKKLETAYLRTMLELAWEGRKVVDTRPVHYTSDGTYLVVTDEEADDRWEESLDSYIDDCLEIPENVQPYFNREAWKRDARSDGRAHSLASYDGREDEVEVQVEFSDDSETFYIYRTN